jgi:hypothetical protein
MYEMHKARMGKMKTGGKPPKGKEGVVGMPD